MDGRVETDMLIDCDTCAVRNVHCHDCVVSVFLALPRAGEIAAPGPAAAVELDDSETDAIGTLMAAGLVPPLRLVALSSPADPHRGIA
jgi:hypothetical protein